MKNNELCPCASGKTYGECCGPILGGERKADTAVELMRARYSAYAVGNVEFLYASSGPEARSEFDEKTTRDWSTSAKWHGLEVLSTVRGGNDDLGALTGKLGNLPGVQVKSALTASKEKKG